MPDYNVVYTDNDSGETEVMTVFDVETEEQALEEADRSLSVMFTDWYTIIRAELREDPE